MTTKLIAFHGDKKIKDKYMKRLKAHYKADAIIKGIYWEDGKGCAVGCTIHGDNHAAYETGLGIPQVLARLEDIIFESLPNSRAKEWPIEFLSSISVGADLSNIWPQFAVWLLIDEKYGVLQFAKTDKEKEAVNAVAKFYSEGKYGKPEHRDEIRKIHYAARAAWSAAADAAAGSAAWSAAAAVWSAARSDDDAAARAARSDDDAAARFAAAAAWSVARSVAAAWSVARSVAAAAAAARSVAIADAAARAAWSAADAAARAARSAAAAAARAARSAAAARAAAAARSDDDAAAGSAARSDDDAAARAARSDGTRWRVAQADKLLELLRAVK